MPNSVRDGVEPSATYALGYSRHEFGRLEMQAAFLRDLTEDVLKRAGLTTGMRVLDLGCGVGDVSMLAGEMVGPSGVVIGVDRSGEAIQTAEKRARQAGQSDWVRFTTGELESFAPDTRFDAVIGRLVLMYLKDPASTLRRLVSCLNPGGVIAFHEMSMPPIRSFPDSPLFSQCRQWILDAFGRAGFPVDMGERLLSTFVDAGLPAPTMIAASRVEGGERSMAYDYMAETLRSLLPAIERTGIATAEEVDIDSLASRLRQQAVALNACLFMPSMIGAWTRVP